MRLHRFYIQKPLGEEILKVENKDLIHQLLSVFRYKEGNEVILFSNTPYEYIYKINSSSKKELTFELKSKQDGVVLDKNITLYMSLVKKDTFEQIVRVCTELGVTRFVPIIAERSEKKSLNVERLNKIAIEATEQCGRTDVPVISPVISLNEAISSLENKDGALVASLFGEEVNNDSFKKIAKNKNISLFIGPEGGWSTEEEEKFKENLIYKTKLTKTVLKADTAASTLVSLLVLN